MNDVLAWLSSQSLAVQIALGLLGAVLLIALFRTVVALLLAVLVLVFCGVVVTAILVCEMLKSILAAISRKS